MNMSRMGYFFLLLATQGMMVASSVQFFLYPLPIPGRTSGTATTAQTQTTPNAISSPFSNFHFQVRNTHDGSYHFGYDAEKSYREEKRDAFGVVTGRYGYLDPTGIHRIVEYIADHNGYRARSTNQFFVEASPPPPVAPTAPPATTIQVIGPIPKPLSQFY
ncbi:unnamed protein product [Orchesella dallaii]|uniref:Uncharacterized protein n=1 Tax=Orchesella dallaii TaxID=48710 RepID=A0ABP1RCI9_9HEXA